MNDSQRDSRKRSARKILVLVALQLSSIALTTLALAGDDDEYNFSWLDPDKKIYVLQNRKYQKAGRVLFSGMLGVGWSNPYRDTFNIDPRVAFYVSESFGVEFFYEFVSNSENNTYQALKDAAPNTAPLVREIKNQYGALAHWVPWYAKINFFNEILYFDWYLEGGLGGINSQVVDAIHNASNPTQQNLMAIFVGTGQQYHLSQHWLVRLDVLGSFYSAQVDGTSGDKKWFSNYNFTAGIGFMP